MQSHPESSVPRVLLIPRSCACLRPFPLTLSAHLREQEVRYKMVAGDRNCKAFRWSSVPQTFGCEVTWVHGLLRCDRVCVSGGGRTREARFCLLSSLHLRWLNISSAVPRPVPDIPYISLLFLSDLSMVQCWTETWSIHLIPLKTQEADQILSFNFADVRKNQNVMFVKTCFIIGLTVLLLYKKTEGTSKRWVS